MKYREYACTGKWADGSLHTDTVYVAHPEIASEPKPDVAPDLGGWPTREIATNVLRMYTDSIRSHTPCAQCGRPMAHFHNPDHKLHPENRVNRMVTACRPLDEIKAEIARCTPLCASCHKQAHNIPRNNDGTWTQQKPAVYNVQDYPNEHLAAQITRDHAAKWLRIRRLAGRCDCRAAEFNAPAHASNCLTRHPGVWGNELRIGEGWIIRKTVDSVPNMPVDTYAEPGKVVLHGDGMTGYGYKSGETAEGSAYQEQRLDCGTYDDFHEHTECDEHGTDCSGLADGETCQECEKVQDCRDGNCDCITRLEQCAICETPLGDGDTVWLCLDGGDMICPDHIVHDERPDSLFGKVGGVRGAMLPASAWPGGYCIVYLTRDNTPLCAECASKVEESDPATDADVDEEMNCGDCEHAQSEHASEKAHRTDGNSDDIGPCEYGHDGPDNDEQWHPCNCEGYMPPLCGDCQEPIDPALRSWWAARNKVTA